MEPFGLKNVELNVLSVYDGRSIKIKIWRNGNNVYTNFCGLYASEDSVECESFTTFSIDYILVYEKKYCLEVCLILFNTQIIDSLDKSLFDSDEN